jgi:hypothetical protein
MERMAKVAATAALILAGILPAQSAQAQEEKKCTLVCAPSLTFAPSLVVTNLFDQARVGNLEDGSVKELEQRETSP